MNEFADWTGEQFEARNNLKVPIEELENSEGLKSTIEDISGATGGLGQSMPGNNATLDWRTLGKVTPVKNQGSCGSCFTFSSAGAMEGAYAIKYNLTTPIELSTQQLLDCAYTSWGNYGCNGGYMTNCYKYLRYYKLQTKDSYPYVGYRKACAYNISNGVTWTVGTGYVNIAGSDPVALENALQLMPISAAVSAYSGVFQFYRGGIIDTSDCGTSLNHAVLIVGYGTDEVLGKDYWIVKNSWGTGWGESGYFRVKKDYNVNYGVCGILRLNSYPTIK